MSREFLISNTFSAKCLRWPIHENCAPQNIHYIIYSVFLSVVSMYISLVYSYVLTLLYMYVPRVAECGVSPGIVGSTHVPGWSYSGNKELVVYCTVVSIHHRRKEGRRQ